MNRFNFLVIFPSGRLLYGSCTAEQGDDCKSKIQQYLYETEELETWSRIELKGVKSKTFEATWAKTYTQDGKFK